VKTVEWIGEAELFRLRESLLPMVRLDRLLGLDGDAANRQDHGYYMVVLESEGCRYGMVVDDLMAPEEIVVKPLSPVLREIGLFSGATVLGTGSLAMILDVAATGQRAGIRTTPEEAVAVAPASLMAAGVSSSFLIFEDHRAGQRSERQALPLSTVVRIESVAIKDIEYAGERPLLQYRGDLLPLEDRGGVLEELRLSGSEVTATVLICQRPGRGSERTATQRIGMVVRRVVEVASGDWLENDAEVCLERLVMVNERLTVVHDGFANEKLRDVA